MVRTAPLRAEDVTLDLDALEELLGEQDLYVWDGNYYALEPMRALGLEDGGAVRAGFLHYTTEDEVDRLLETLAAFAD